MFRDDVTRSFESAYPDVAYFRREAAHGAQMEGSGEFGRLLTYCLFRRSGNRCVELQESLSLQQARNTISSTFGAPPAVAGYRQMKSVDDEAGLGVAPSPSQPGRHHIARAQACSL